MMVGMLFLRMNCSALGSNITLCLTSSFPCIYNISSSECLDFGACTPNLSNNILSNNATIIKCFADLFVGDDPSGCASYVGWIGFIGLLIWICILGCMFKQEKRIEKIYGLSLGLSLFLFTLIVFVSDFQDLSCGPQWAIIYTIIGVGPLIFMPIICCGNGLAECIFADLERMREKKKIILYRKMIEEIFSTSTFTEKYITRLILDYYGEFKSSDLNLFAGIREPDAEDEEITIEMEEHRALARPITPALI